MNRHSYSWKHDFLLTMCNVAVASLGFSIVVLSFSNGTPYLFDYENWSGLKYVMGMVLLLSGVLSEWVHNYGNRV